MPYVNRLLPKASRHNFEGDATRIILSPNEHIAPAVRTCKGSIYPPASPESPSGGSWRAGRTRNDGRHKCRPYKDLKRKFLYYQVTNLEQPHCVNCIWATAYQGLTPCMEIFLYFSLRNIYHQKTKSRDVAQSGRAQRSGRWGRWFKSSRPDHEIKFTWFSLI